MDQETKRASAAGAEERQKEVAAAMAELTTAVELFNAASSSRAKDVEAAQRRSAIDAANRLLRAIREPADQWWDYMIQTAQITATRLLWDWGVFDAIPLEGSISYAELAAKTSTEESLLVRVAHVLVAFGILVQTLDGAVAHTELSQPLTSAETSGLVFQMAWENGFFPYARYPDYFEKYGRKEPQTRNHIPHTFAYNVPQYDYYEILTHNPPRMERFTRAMAPVEARMPIAGIYDFSWVVAKAQEDANRPLFVDVGGGRGHAILAIHDEFPALPLSRCVLQDRPEVIKVVSALGDEKTRQIPKMVIDFHNEQPIRGALVYWVRRCFHTFSDNVCTNMLRILARVLAEDSRILIEEDIHDDPPHNMAAMLDFMMLGLGGKERQLSCWEKVIGNAGLKIRSISRGKGPWRTLSVIECVKEEAS